jgi:type IV secretory pathway component VirB8
MKIKDNFLKQEEFNRIQDFMMGKNFPWYYTPSIDETSDVDKFQFVHLFYQDGVSQHYHVSTSDRIKMLTPIIQALQPFSIWRVKANLLTKTSTIVENKFHVDLTVDLNRSQALPKEKLKQWTISIFYINTNNGYTLFENGTRVDSVANRMVTFPANLKHTGTSCTDERTRVIINFNYFTLL